MRNPMALIPLLLACPLAAQPHQHGHAELNIVLQGEQVGIELLSPADNLLGFEHAAVTAAERQQLAQVRELLLAAPFELSAAAQCVQTGAEQDWGAVEAHMDDHADHDHDHDHADIQLSYLFSCQAPAKLSQISTSLFSHFSALQSLRVQLLSDAGQQLATLSPEQTVVDLND